MINVQINDNSDEAFEKGLRRFKKACSKDGFLREVRDRRYFKKPSAKRHEKEQEVERERKRDKNKKGRNY